MAVDVPMPKLGLTMEEATIIEWLVADGDAVDSDQPRQAATARHDNTAVRLARKQRADLVSRRGVVDEDKYLPAC